MGDWLTGALDAELWLGWLGALRWQDVVDILLVSYILYRLLHWVRDTRAIQLLRGLALLVAVYFISATMGLQTMTWLMQSMALMVVVAVPVVFQPELRRMLTQLGQANIFFPPPEGTRGQDIYKLVNEVANAARLLSQERIGALIVVERKTGLGEFIETGVYLGAVVNAELLTTIFQPGGPLHDGAVIIRGQQIACASALLPLAEDVQGVFSSRSHLGTRHRAALGLSESTDALCIVVSEETGDISVAIEGRLHRHLSEESLRDLLVRHFQTEVARATAPLQPMFKGLGKRT